MLKLELFFIFIIEILKVKAVMSTADLFTTSAWYQKLTLCYEKYDEILIENGGICEKDLKSKQLTSDQKNGILQQNCRSNLPNERTKQEKYLYRSDVKKKNNMWTKTLGLQRKCKDREDITRKFSLSI